MIEGRFDEQGANFRSLYCAFYIVKKYIDKKSCQCYSNIIEMTKKVVKMKGKGVKEGKKMMGKIEGYQIKTLHKNVAKKKNFGISDSSFIEMEEQQNTVLSALKKNGYVFGIYEKKELKACYVFEKVKVREDEIPYPKYDIDQNNAWDFITGHEILEAEESQVLEKMVEGDSKEVWIYRLIRVYNKMVPAHIIEQFEKAIVKEFKELLFFDEVKAVIWNEKILAAKRVKVGADKYVSVLPLGISIGMLFGVALDNIGIGLCFGVAWGLIFGMVFTTAGRKNVGEEK